MAGNVSEWVADWFSATCYGESPSSNPTGPEWGTDIVLRGGAWYDMRYDVGVVRPTGRVPCGSNNRFGFRCAAGGP
jgi:sulfatase modifying factor 1